MEPLNILLIEDNIEDSLWVEIQLKRNQSNPFTLRTCEYFSHAQDLIQKEKFSLIILDLCLPDSRGLETLKKFVQSTHVPIIVYTGMSDQLVIDEAFNAGISDFLVKGKTSADALWQSINVSLEKWQFEKRK